MKQETIPQHFDRRALEFGRDYRACDYGCRISYAQRKQAVLGFMSGVEGKRILDIGCGPGILTAPLAQANRLVGIDPSFHMLKLAQPSLLAIQGFGERLPLKDGSFDFVLAIETLQLVKEPGLFVRELARVTNKGGVVIFSSLHKDSWLHHVFSAMKSYRRLHFHSLEDIEEGLNSCGIGQIEIMGLRFPFPLRPVMKPKTGKLSPLASSWIIRGVKQ